MSILRSPRQLAARLVVAALVTAAAVVPALPHGASAAPAEPTSSATAGWYLTLVEQGRPTREGGFRARHTTLVLVDPHGARRELRGWSTHHERQSIQLLAWSADGATALVERSANDGSSFKALLVDVATGEVTSSFEVGETASITLDATGTHVLTTGFGHGSDDGYPIFRYDAAGHRTRLGTTTSTGLLPWADSTIITGGATGGGRLRVLDAATGDVVARIPTPHRFCSPVRSWDDAHALVSCYSRSGHSQLGLVDPDGGALHLLTARHPKGSPDLGDLDARRIPQGLFLQASGPCGYTFIAQALAHGRVRTVHVRHAVGNVLMVGTAGDRLVVQHAASCDGAAPRSVLARLNPATGRERVLVRLAADQQFARLLGYGETVSS